MTKQIAERGLQPGAARDLARAGRRLSDHFAVVLDREVVSRPIINFVENPAGIDGRTGAQIEGSFDIRRPRTWPSSSRSAPSRST